MTAKTVKAARGITYGQLERLLRRWGFRRERSSSVTLFEREIPMTLFEHKTQDALLAFAQHAPDEPVRPIDLVGTRKYLDERGIVERAEFDRRTQGVRTA
jgi:hypothetical protein